MSVTCPHCIGAGSIVSTDTTRGPDGAEHRVGCPTCAGTGWVAVPERAPIDDPRFYVVWALPQSADEFCLQGVFSREADALEFQRHISAPKHQFLAAGIDGPLSMPHILRTLGNERLGALAKRIELMAAEDKS